MITPPPSPSKLQLVDLGLKTTNQCTVGLTAEQLRRNAAILHAKRIELEGNRDRHENKLAFLYDSESNKYGKGIPYSGSKLTEEMLAMQENRFRAQKMRKLRVQQVISSKDNANHIFMTPCQVEEELTHIKHDPKQQHARFTTESNSYGAQKLTPGTFPSVQMPRSQKFSSSFPIVKDDCRI